jgi:hypothetical protein
VAHVNRPAMLFQGALDDLDGAVYTCAKTAWIG